MTFFGKLVRGPPQIYLISVERGLQSIFLPCEQNGGCYSGLTENRVLNLKKSLYFIVFSFQNDLRCIILRLYCWKWSITTTLTRKQHKKFTLDSLPVFIGS